MGLFKKTVLGKPSGGKRGRCIRVLDVNSCYDPGEDETTPTEIIISRLIRSYGQVKKALNEHKLS